MFDSPALSCGFAPAACGIWHVLKQGARRPLREDRGRLFERSGDAHLEAHRLDVLSKPPRGLGVVFDDEDAMSRRGHGRETSKSGDLSPTPLP